MQSFDFVSPNLSVYSRYVSGHLSIFYISIGSVGIVLYALFTNSNTHTISYIECIES